MTVLYILTVIATCGLINLAIIRLLSTREVAMKILFILNDAPYGSERTYNGLRLVGWTGWADKVLVF